MFFEKKKIKIETLSEYLKEVREKLKLSLDEVAARSGVALNFLKSLESGNFEHLPADVYVFGFLRQLAQFYSIEPQSLIDQYKKEKTIQVQLERQSCQARSWPKVILKKIVITPKSFSLIVGLLFVVVTIGYIIWQVFSINRTPHLQILQPKNQDVINGSFAIVKGSTNPGIMVTVNDEPVFVDKEGNFTFPLSIGSGPKDLVFVAKNKFDKSISKTISIIGGTEQGHNEQQLQMKIEFSGNATLSFAVDDALEQTQEFHQGDSKNLLANNKIVLSTSDAGVTRVVLNNQDLGSLGRSGEKLSYITFFAENANIE